MRWSQDSRGFYARAGRFTPGLVGFENTGGSRYTVTQDGDE